MNTILNVYYPSYYINDYSIGTIQINSYYKAYFNENMSDFMKNQYLLKMDCNSIGTRDGKRYVYWDNVTNMTNAFYGCSNLTGNAVETNNAISLQLAYCDCSNLSKAYCGNNTVILDSAYYNCGNISNAVCGDNVITMSYAYCNCNNIRGEAVSGSNVVNMTGSYMNCANLTVASCGNNVQYFNDAYQGCLSLKNTSALYNLNNVIYMRNAFRNCGNFSGVASCGINTVDMGFAYYGCNNLRGYPVCSNAVQDYSLNGEMFYGFDSTYYGCENLIGSPVCPPNVTSMAYSYFMCSNLVGSPTCGLNVTNMYDTYVGCYSLTGEASCGNKVVDFTGTYSGCGRTTSDGATIGISKASCSDSVRYMSRAYASCYNLTSATIGNNVIDASYAYMGVFNIKGRLNCWYQGSEKVNLLGIFSGRNIFNHLDIYVKRNKSYDREMFDNSINNGCGNIVYEPDGARVRKLASTPIKVGDIITPPSLDILYNNFVTINYSVNPPTVNVYSYNVISSPTNYFYANIDYTRSNVNGTLQYYYYDTPGIHWTPMTNGYYNSYWNINVYNNLGIIGNNATGIKNLPMTDKDFYRYNGQSIVPIWNWFEGSENIYTLSGQLEGVNTGVYTATVTLKEGTGYEWENPDEPHEVKWIITYNESDLVDYGRVGSMHVRNAIII